MKTFLRILDAFNSAVSKGAGYLASILVAFMILIVFCGVVWRYLLRDSLSWVDEMAALTLVVVSFLGCYVAMFKRKLARIDLFIGMFNGWAKKAAYAVSELVSLTLIVVVIYYGAQLFLMPTSLRQRTPGMYIPLWIFYGLIPLSFLLNALVSLANILHYVYDEPEKSETTLGKKEGGSI